MRRAAKVDVNQPEIVKCLRAMGAHVLHTHQLKNAFDILVGYHGNLYIMEIKDGSLPPSAKKLSTGEQSCKTKFNAVGVDYHIVENCSQAIDILNQNTKGTL